MIWRLYRSIEELLAWLFRLGIKLLRRASMLASGGGDATDRFEGWGRGGISRRPNGQSHPKVWTRSKWKKCQKWHAGEVQVRDNPEGGELDPADNVHNRCKKHFPSFYPV